MALSPMMKQYTEIKETVKDSILFFRLGDFYEMFFDDAITVTKELGLTLTGRNCGLEEKAPMCGVPFHSAEDYISKLVEKGYKVAICEQVEDPNSVKGIVRREIVQIVTPGTLISGNGLKDAENNFLASVYVGKERVSLSYCDISTGELEATEFKNHHSETTLINELVRIAPKELIVNKNAETFLNISNIRNNIDVYINILDEEFYGYDSMRELIKSQFKVQTLKGVSIEKDEKSLVFALGAQISYLRENKKGDLSNISFLKRYSIGETMVLDKATIRNLEITETLMEKKSYGSLLWVLDKTHTAMGGRKIKKWLREPLNKIDEINKRLNGVEFLVEQPLVRNHIKEDLKAIYDFERLTGKIAYGSANGKDVIALKNSLEILPDIKYDIEDSGCKIIEELHENLDILQDVTKMIDDAIVEEPPFSRREGGIIKRGYSPQLDEMKASIREAKEWISSLEAVERKRTGIPNLKVGYNRVFGYYIDVTKSHFDKVPEEYIRKQTLANSERYITPKLKETETIVLNAESKINQKEYEVFVEIRDLIKEQIYRILKTSSAIATLDVLTSFAHVSEINGYVKPTMTTGDEILLEKGRHPVVEKIMNGGVFVQNDLYMNRNESSMLLITGPNMAGKSTYMRQNAIIVLMAQSGCFVPCDKAVIGVVDRIFTRIGASDNLGGGQSTFYVEMNELAYIINNKTQDSLIILDEIGRGTSTYDGLSIAWSVAEHLCKSDCKTRTLFATHYHELTQLEGELSGFKNLNVDVVDENGKVIFLHKIVEGSASRSYGIHVAKIAGVPKDLLDRAEEKLKELEKNQRKHLNMHEEQIRFNF